MKIKIFKGDCEVLRYNDIMDVFALNALDMVVGVENTIVVIGSTKDLYPPNLSIFD